VSNENPKKNSQMNLEELLALLKNERGEDAVTPTKKVVKPIADEESSLDNYEFDDTPIEADYLNYNRIGVGVSAVNATVKKNDGESVEALEAIEAPDEIEEVEELDEIEEVEELDEIEEVEELEEIEEVEELEEIEEVEELEEIEEVEELEEIEEVEELDEIEEVEELDEIEEVEELDEIEEVEELDEVEEVEELDEVEEVEELDEVEEVEDLDEIEEVEELDEVEEVEDLDEIEEVEELDEIEEVEELDEIEEVEELDEIEEVEELDEIEEVEELDEIEEVEELDEIEEVEELDEIEEVEELDEIEEVEELDEIEEVEALDEIEEVEELDEIEAVEELDEIEEVEELDEIEEVEKLDESENHESGFVWTPKKRQKGSTTPIDEAVFDDYYAHHAVMPSRKGDKEFTSYSQREYIKNAYKAHLQKEFRLLGWLLLVSLFAFLCENMDLLGVTVLSLDTNPFLAIGVSLVWIVLSAVLVGREFLDGVKLLASGKVIPESVLLVALLVPLGYYGYALLSGDTPLMLFGFAFAALALLTKLQTVLRYLREAKTFRVVALEKPKRVLSVLPDEQKTAEADAFSAYVSPDTRYYAVKRALFVDDYFKMTNAIAKNKLTVLLFMALSLAASTLVFVISMLSYTWEQSLSYALISFYYTLPFSSLLLFEVPIFRAAFAAYEKQAAIVGEAAAEQYTGEGVVSFVDSDIFSPADITLCNILLFREAHVEKLLAYTALAFDEINSPVASVIKQSIPQYQFDDEITVVDVYDGGLEVKINGERVILGSYAFMQENRIAMPKGYVYAENGYSQLFVAVEGELLGKYDFDYRMDRDSKGALDYLERSGYYIALRTLDPNITYELLKKMLRYDVSPICIVKTGDNASRLRMRKRGSSPIVSASRAKSLVAALVLLGKSALSQKIGMFFSAISMVTGALVVLLSVKLGSSVLLSGLGVVLFQCFWLLPGLLTSVLCVRNRRSKKK